MTNPTLERAARAALTACNQSAAYVDMDGDLSCATVDGLVDFYEIARAVLMAVQSDEEIARMVYAAESYAHVDWVKIWPEQIQAILNDGEGE